MRFHSQIAAAMMVCAILLQGRDAFALDALKSIRQYVHRTWDIDDGLPENSIAGLVQSDDGYLWFGTRDGLVRFDGARFTVFNRLNTPAFRSNVVLAVHKSKDGTLWIGTDDGLVRMSNGVFAGFSTSDGLASNFVAAIASAADGR